jgi:hypothetical protein
MKRFIAYTGFGAVLTLLVVFGLLYVVQTPGRILRDFQQSLQANHEREVKLFMQVNRLTPMSKHAVAELENVVTGSYASHKSLAGFDLGSTSLEYRVPVKYVYAVDFSLASPVTFNVDVDTQTLYAIFPSLEVLAIEADLGQLEKDLSVGWARMRSRSGQDVEEMFRARVMDDIRAHAASADTISLVREPARKQMKTFTRNFLAHRELLGDEGIERIEVRFADEARQPVVRLIPDKMP